MTFGMRNQMGPPLLVVCCVFIEWPTTFMPIGAYGTSYPMRWRRLNVFCRVKGVHNFACGKIFLVGPKNALAVRIRFLFTFYSHKFYASYTCGGMEMNAEEEKNSNHWLIRWIVARVTLKKRKWKSEWKNETKRHFRIIAQFICTRNGSQLSIMNPRYHFAYTQHLHIFYARFNGKGFHLAVIVSSSSPLPIVALVAVCIARHDKCTCALRIIYIVWKSERGAMWLAERWFHLNCDSCENPKRTFFAPRCR